jgi:hypothetical protein
MAFASASPQVLVAASAIPSSLKCFVVSKNDSSSLFLGLCSDSISIWQTSGASGVVEVGAFHRGDDDARVEGCFEHATSMPSSPSFDEFRFAVSVGIILWPCFSKLTKFRQSNLNQRISI